MGRAADATAIAGAVLAVGAVLVGGGFEPGPRLVVGVVLAAVAAAGAAAVSGGPRPDEVAVAAWLAWGATTVIVVAAAPLASKEALTVWLAAVCVLAGTRRASPAIARWALAVLVAGAAAVGLSVVVEWLASAGARAGGVLENPNLTVAVLVPTAAIAVGLAPSGRRRTWWWVAAAVSVLAVTATGSRAGLLALVVLAVVLVPRPRVRVAAASIVLVLAAVVLLARFAKSPDVLAWHRPAIWRAVVATWADRPVTGVSPGALVDAVRPHRPEHPDFVGRRQMVPAYAESTPLAVLVQTGAVGLGLLAAALVLAVRAARRREAPVGRGVAAAAAAAGTIALFHDLLTADPVLWWWAVLAGAAGAADAGESDPSSGADGHVRAWVWGAAAAWLVLWGIVQPAWARYRWGDEPATTVMMEAWQRAEPWDDVPMRRRLSVLLGRGTWERAEAAEALATAERAVTIHRGRAEAWGDLGRVRARIATEHGDAVSVAEARRALETSCRLDPWVPWTWLEWARLERATGRVDAARSLVERALEAEPATVRAWLFAASLELDRGRPDAARRAYEQALTLIAGRGDPNLSVYERQLLAADPRELRAIGDRL